MDRISWEEEIAIYEDANLRRASSQKLATTQAECKRLIIAMRQAEAKIDPVLIMFRDRVLFLKHNLNAVAIAAIESDLSLIKLEINELTREIENSINEADRFINNLES